ncbi:MAG: FkbM family methyltransferase [Nitrososphaerota archaeon]|jgi:FkbM family methyltransferase|nr:FkbM family methyltransferase [Nitrososphaerota archaeon]
MVTVAGLIRTVVIVKNPFAILALRLRKKPVKVTFSNGAVFQITWPQFRSLRDNYELVKKYNLQQISEDIFKITTGSYQLVGSRVMMYTIDEMEAGSYGYDYRGKVVLDIGGFEGDSAAFFWSRGAKKIVIYEPMLEHHRFIDENISLNKINAEVHAEGIGSKDGEITVVYDHADNCFGLETRGSQNKMIIKIKDVTKVIAESGADVAKIDCEGAEISLIDVPKDTLRKLEYVMVETHTPQIRRQLIEKFKNSGFVVTQNGNEDKDKEISIISFKRVDTEVINQ